MGAGKGVDAGQKKARASRGGQAATIEGDRAPAGFAVKHTVADVGRKRGHEAAAIVDAGRDGLAFETSEQIEQDGRVIAGR